MLTYTFFRHTNRKWLFCNVCWCLCLKKSPFLATNTHETVKYGHAKENKFNTVICISVNWLWGQSPYVQICNKIKSWTDEKT